MRVEPKSFHIAENYLPNTVRSKILLLMSMFHYCLQPVTSTVLLFDWTHFSSISQNNTSAHPVSGYSCFPSSTLCHSLCQYKCYKLWWCHWQSIPSDSSHCEFRFKYEQSCKAVRALFKCFIKSLGRITRSVRGLERTAGRCVHTCGAEAQ